jgi:hypothetical protein
MKNMKWITVVALSTGMLFQLGGCGTLGTLGAALLGLIALQGIGT